MSSGVKVDAGFPRLGICSPKWTVPSAFALGLIVSVWLLLSF